MAVDPINKWTLNRAGVLNFWYYDEEEFSFNNGHLLLRGSNGSGKTVTMTSLFPFLLDGRKTPERMDSFGSRDRRMIDYLLGEKGFSDEIDEKTGYLYLEFKREQTAQYLTIGMGLNARKSRGNNLDSWGFSITDNRRINTDLKLYNEEKGINQTINKIPLTKKKLLNLIGEGGKVVAGQKDYAQMVNELLFGYEDFEAFEELIELLVQIREPKLSNNFKPSTIYNILNKSLPALTEDELRPLADTMETMDNHSDQVALLKTEIVQFKSLTKEYQKYNKTILKDKLEHYLVNKQESDSVEKNLIQVTEEIEKVKKDLLDNKREEQQKEKESQSLHVELNTLKNSEVFKYQEQKMDLEQRMTDTKTAASRQEQAIERKRQSIRKFQTQMETLQTAVYRAEKEVANNWAELEELQYSVQYPQHSLYSPQIQVEAADLSNIELIETWKNKIEEYQKQLHSAMQLWSRYNETTRRYEESFKEYDIAYEELQKRRDELKQYQEVFNSEKNMFSDQVYKWLASNEWISVTPTDNQSFSRKIEYIFERTDQEELLSPFFKQASEYNDKLQVEKIQLDQDQKQLAQELSELQSEKVKWEQMNDPEPVRHFSSEHERLELRESGALVLPFYQAVNFKEEVPESIRYNIEAALEDSGLLDALIVEDSLVETIKFNSVLKANPQKDKKTLAQFLETSSNDLLIMNKVQDIIESIIVNDEIEFSGANVPEISTNGAYRLGIILGNTPQEKFDSPHFIGKAQREAYRKLQIKQLDEDYAVKKQLQIDVVNKITDIEDSQKEQMDWIKNQPSVEDMRIAFNDVKSAELREKNQASETHRKDELRQQSNFFKQEQGQKLKEGTQQFILPFEYSSYQEAEKDVIDYRIMLADLSTLYNGIQGKNNTLSDIKFNLGETQFDLDELQDKERELEDLLRQLKFEYQRTIEVLDELGEKTLQQQIQKTQNDLRETKNQYNTAKETRIRLEERIPTLEERENADKKNTEFYRELISQWKQLLLKELYYQGKEVDIDSTIDIENWLLQLKDNSYSTVKDAEQRLSNIYTKSYDQLIDYRITQQSKELMTLDPKLVSEYPKTEWQILINELRNETQRSELSAEYKGTRKEIQYVYEQLQEDLEYQNLMLRKDEDKLYRDIIINNLGKMIQGKVLRAEKWVKETEEYMQKRQNSSGLLFSIRWKPITGENENQLSTKQLVTILRKGPDLLKETEIEQVREHFQSKIKAAKLDAQDEQNDSSFFKELTQILDYRNWFNFELQFKKGDQNFRPLTNKAFNQMSGGEKAMTMYIPLFSAAHSRYKHAKKDAPYIVVLDEAFAGVDEKNIQDMFGLLEDLKFNYVLTSQSLWGDYPNVKSLSMSELVRPNNADFVSIIQYSWNGHERQLQLSNLDADADVQNNSDEPRYEQHPLKEPESKSDKLIQKKKEEKSSEDYGEQASLF